MRLGIQVRKNPFAQNRTFAPTTDPTNTIAVNNIFTNHVDTTNHIKPAQSMEEESKDVQMPVDTSSTSDNEMATSNANRAGILVTNKKQALPSSVSPQ